MYTTMRMGAYAISLAIAGLSLWGTAGEARAQNSEMERLAQCDRDLCSAIRTPSPDRARPLQCDLSRTFYKEQIGKAARSRRLSWPFGDANCSLKLNVERGIFSRAMTDNNYTLKVPKHPASCEVEYKGERWPVTVMLAPEIKFRDGRATEVTIGVQEIEANIVIKALLWSASKLEDSFGLFQSDFVNGVNRYVDRHCRARPGSNRRQVLLDELRLVE